MVKKELTQRLSDKEKAKLQALSLENKIQKSKEVILEAFEKFHSKGLAVAWTGGKDSTLLLWLVRKVAQENNFELPICEFIDEGDTFPEIWDFINKYKREWKVKVVVYHNKDVSSQVGGKIGARVEVARLNKRNREEVARLGYKGKYFLYEPESFIGNHLMKTVMINKFIEDFKIKGYLVGIRWDEQEARADEVYFSPRPKTKYNPEHMRVFPLLHFREKDVWAAIHKFDIPYVKLYAEGYRSLGAKTTTEKVDEKPAWLQDLDRVPERIGRRQDKEKIMRRLRELGYM